MEKLTLIAKKIAEKILDEENKRRKFANFLREINSEEKLLTKVTPEKLEDIRIVGVDGGIVKKSLHGFESILARAAGVCFCYKEGKVDKVEYFPSRFPTPMPFIFDILSELEFFHSNSIIRQAIEIETAIKCIKKLKPDLLLLHGSIIPHYSDKPKKDSKVYEDYKNLIKIYEKLFEESIKRKVMLASVIEDSRATRFCEIIKKEILPKINHKKVSEIEKLLNKTGDTNILFWVLEQGERTKIFKYSEYPKEHPVLRDFDKFNMNLYAFYLKTAKWDRPIRVDFLRNKEIEDKLAGILLAISSHHSGYGMPTPIIEADNVAKLSEAEIENFFAQVSSFTGNIPSLMKLRREERPF